MVVKWILLVLLFAQYQSGHSQMRPNVEITNIPCQLGSPLVPSRTGDPTKYMQCGAHGQYMILPCIDGTVFESRARQCVPAATSHGSSSAQFTGRSASNFFDPQQQQLSPQFAQGLGQISQNTFIANQQQQAFPTDPRFSQFSAFSMPHGGQNSPASQSQHAPTMHSGGPVPDPSSNFMNPAFYDPKTGQFGFSNGISMGTLEQLLGNTPHNPFLNLGPKFGSQHSLNDKLSPFTNRVGDPNRFEHGGPKIQQTEFIAIPQNPPPLPPPQQHLQQQSFQPPPTDGPPMYLEATAAGPMSFKFPKSIANNQPNSPVPGPPQQPPPPPQIQHPNFPPQIDNRPHLQPHSNQLIPQHQFQTVSQSTSEQLFGPGQISGGQHSQFSNFQGLVSVHRPFDGFDPSQNPNGWKPVFQVNQLNQQQSIQQPSHASSQQAQIQRPQVLQGPNAPHAWANQGFLPTTGPSPLSNEVKSRGPSQPPVPTINVPLVRPPIAGGQAQQSIAGLVEGATLPPSNEPLQYVIAGPPDPQTGQPTFYPFKPPAGFDMSNFDPQASAQQAFAQQQKFGTMEGQILAGRFGPPPPARKAEPDPPSFVYLDEQCKQDGQCPFRSDGALFCPDLRNGSVYYICAPVGWVKQFCPVGLHFAGDHCDNIAVAEEFLKKSRNELDVSDGWDYADDLANAPLPNGVAISELPLSVQHEVNGWHQSDGVQEFRQNDNQFQAIAGLPTATSLPQLPSNTEQTPPDYEVEQRVTFSLNQNRNQVPMWIPKIGAHCSLLSDPRNQLWPDPSDQRLFYMCVSNSKDDEGRQSADGSWVRMQCPIGTIFDPYLRQCDDRLLQYEKNHTKNQLRHPVHDDASTKASEFITLGTISTTTSATNAPTGRGTSSEV